MLRPATVTVPLVGRSKPAISASSDDLPEPDGPVSATSSPGSSVSDTPSTATILPGWTRRTSSTTTRAPPGVAPLRPGCTPGSATGTDPVVVVPGATPLDADLDAEREPVADGARRPRERGIAHDAHERVR